MKKTACHLLSAAFFLSLPAAAFAADGSLNSTSILRVYQDDRAGFASKDLAPVTEFLALDAEKLGDGNLSAHLYGWGRLDLADDSFNNGTTDASLTYGYLMYRFKNANAQARAGRFMVTDGIVNEHVDGVSASTDLPYGFRVSAFGGAPVHTQHLANENTDGKGNGIFGGRLGYRFGGMLEVGVSGVYESGAPSLDRPGNIALERGGRLGDHRLVGGDIWFSPVRAVELIGHTSYNTETSGIAEHTYLLNLKPAKKLLVAAEFSEHHERNYFYSSALFASMVGDLSEKSRTTGLSGSYELGQGTEVSADYKHYSRDIGSADRFGANVRFTHMDNTMRSGIGYHYLNADSGFAINPATDDSASFHEVRCYTMRDTKTFFGALDAIGYIFKEKINNEKSAWETIGSVGYHITPALALSGDLSYGQNPQYNDDLKGLVRLTYNMNYSGKGDAK